MNLSIMKLTAKALFRRPIRISLLLGCLILTGFMTAMGLDRHSELNPTHLLLTLVPPVTLIVAAGIIGQDVSDGVLPLLLSRPIKRWQYVFSKWVATVVMVVVVLLVNWLVLSLIVSVGTHASVQGISPLDVAQLIVTVAGSTAVILLLSTLFPGCADVGVLVALALVGLILMAINEKFHSSFIRSLENLLSQVLYLNYDLRDIRSWRSFMTVSFGQYICELVLCIVGAIYLFNKKELSYGGD